MAKTDPPSPEMPSGTQASGASGGQDEADWAAIARSIVVNAPAGIALYDPQGNCMEANDALALMVGATREQLLAQNFRRLDSWRQSGLAQAGESCLDTGQTVTLDAEVTTTFGIGLTAKATFVPLTLRGCRHVLFMAQDVTTERNREESLRAFQDRLTGVHDIAAEISSATDIEHVLQTTISRAREALHATLGAIVRIDPGTGRPGAIYTSNYPMDAVPNGTTIAGRGMLAAIAAGATVHSNSIVGEPGFVGFPSWHPAIEHMIGLPLCDRDRAMAILLLGRSPGTQPFAPEDYAIADTIANLASVALRVAEQFDQLQVLNRQLEELATTDALMQIGNRRAFEAAMPAQHAIALRYGIPYGVLMADVDRFKQYNDQYGHPAGDGVLAKVATTLKSAIRAADKIFRYGGEELVILLPHQSREGIARAGERLRALVEDAAIEHQGNTPGVVTLSFGGAVFEPSKKELRVGWTDVVRAADEALYRAKRSGRNRVEVA
jgi:diguanylate cyclase (GGDEF)-like protein/PAS domain S-box-containing protein